ncbi:hypothetical protein Val02_44130 [Virgisporangium aliadipatigenens]|uniref:Uncharacterized protein n=1 Tax=Virgisporangium aliadipatigenens TaxID=741659 RepID=A0A8J3YND3_9ACTN|nr:hypothetical protein [Virgisporangium aliadipatigenens]GIJ47527.1 hypothetical protein Val02_44130 [Virgisporangium aliadipatigenens]
MAPLTRAGWCRCVPDAPAPGRAWNLWDGVTVARPVQTGVVGDPRPRQPDLDRKNDRDA